MNSPKSTIRDGWGMLLNAESHLSNNLNPNAADAIALIRKVRQNVSNLNTWVIEWTEEMESEYQKAHAVASND